MAPMTGTIREGLTEDRQKKTAKMLAFAQR